MDLLATLIQVVIGALVLVGFVGFVLSIGVQLVQGDDWRHPKPMTWWRWVLAVVLGCVALGLGASFFGNLSP